MLRTLTGFFKEWTFERSAICMLFCFLVIAGSAFPGFVGDMGCWAKWSSYILAHGLSKTYDSDTNYMPAFQYLLWIFARICGSVVSINAHVRYFRGYVILADFIALYLAWKWSGKKYPWLTILVFSFANIAFSYNTIIWGQVDGLLAVLALAAIYLAWRSELSWSAVIVTLAINMKLQMLPLLPVWGLLVLYSIVAERRWRQMIIVPLAMLITQMIILLPFGIHGAQQAWSVAFNSSGYFPRITMRAYNGWYWLMRQAEYIDDNQKGPAGLTWKQWGVMAFILFGTLALLPMMRHVIKAVKSRVGGRLEPIPAMLIWDTSALIVILFFFCNTEMHERYVHPAFIFLTIRSLATRRFMLYTIFSLAYFLNMEAILQFLHLRSYGTLIFDPRFVAGLYAIVIAVLFAAIYKRRALEEADYIQQVKPQPTLATTQAQQGF